MQVKRAIEVRATAPMVWAALTKPDLTKQYFFGCEAVSDWRVGSPVSYSTVSDGKRTVHVSGVVKAYEPHRLLECTCVAAGFEGNPEKETTVTWSLSPRGDLTEVAVTQGEFHDRIEYTQVGQSADAILAGLKRLVEGSNLV